MLLVHGFLICWLVGGVGLLTMLLMRTARRPAGLLLALVGFGGGGFVAEGLGLPYPLKSGVLAAIALGLIGYALQPRTTREVTAITPTPERPPQP